MHASINRIASFIQKKKKSGKPPNPNSALYIVKREIGSCGRMVQNMRNGLFNLLHAG